MTNFYLEPKKNRCRHSSKVYNTTKRIYEKQRKFDLSGIGMRYGTETRKDVKFHTHTSFLIGVTIILKGLLETFFFFAQDV